MLPARPKQKGIRRAELLTEPDNGVEQQTQQQQERGHQREVDSGRVHSAGHVLVRGRTMVEIQVVAIHEVLQNQVEQSWQRKSRHW